MKQVREIKFRVWDKYGKYMRYLGDDSHDSIEFFDENRASYYNLQCGDGGASTTEEDCDGYGFSPLMQYTGLKDKNGKEIYEGDILITKDIEGGKYKTFVTHENGMFLSGEESLYDDVFLFEAEVVGNIYENPELLKV